MTADRLTGGCGAMRFEVTAPLGAARYCHCTCCQRRTGTAASASAITAPGSIVVTQGAEDLRGWAPEGGRDHVSCVACASAPWEPIPDDGLARHAERMPRV